MTMELSDFETRRADNLIWNGAGDYGIETGLRVFDAEGRAQLYWNTVIGAVHRHYTWDELLELYASFADRKERQSLESIFWMVLEAAVFRKEERVRPVFPFLRKEYALHTLAEGEEEAAEGEETFFLPRFYRSYLRRILGETEPCGTSAEEALLDQILDGDKPEDTAGMTSFITALLDTYFPDPAQAEQGKTERERISWYERLHLERFVLWSWWGRKGKKPSMPVRRLAFGYAEHSFECDQNDTVDSHYRLASAQQTRKSEEDIREYISGYFGMPALEQSEILRLQQEYCTGTHADICLHLTRGVYDESGKNRFAKQKSRLIREQTEANIRAYKDKEDRYLIAINRLAQRIRNTLLVHLEDESVRSRTGTLIPLRIWRATELNDPMVFNKLLKGDRGNITVDILIDSSFSQVKRRETVAAQGYMIAESLTRCGIPVRMYSFLSMSGYLVMDLYRDYQEQGKNDQVFRYYTAGANRDGLAVRMAAAFMKDNRAEHRILMILSDCKPNDAARVRPESGRFEDYASELGIEDTAVEVHRARMEGIDVLCIFTGDDAELPNARRIYGQDFARIRSLDQFADTVGSLLQSRIRNL